MTVFQTSFQAYFMTRPINTTLLCLALLFLPFLAKSQVNFGLFAGPQLSSAHYVIADEVQPTHLKAGFQTGLMMKVPFDNQLFFAPAAFYSLKGYKVSFRQPSYPPDTAAVDNNTSVHTLEIAVLLQYDFSIRPDHFYLKSGISLDGQLFGNETYHLRNGKEVKQKMKFSFGEYGYAGSNFLVILGYENARGLTIFGQYSLGLGNLNNADGGPQIRHRVFGISVGQYFNRKKKANS